MNDTPPVILIGLDAVEIDVVDRLVADGRMPNLARLRQQGRWRQALEPGKHHMGTTRMHLDSRQGVVDQNSRVHGTSNLFVTGSSVFPSGGYANPALTIVALAVRLGDHLSRDKASTTRLLGEGDLRAACVAALWRPASGVWRLAVSAVFMERSEHSAH
jgi:choline dehydrogenase-like flavoprotein